MKRKNGKEQTYLQCELTKPIDGGVGRMVSWIREELAVVGNIIDRLEDTETGKIECGWTVANVSPGPMPESLLLRQAHNSAGMQKLSEA